MSLPPLKVKIEGDTKGLDDALERVKKSVGGLQGVTDKVGRGLQGFGGATQNLGRRMLPLSAGITAAATGMFMLANGTAKAGDEIAKSARGAGVSADALQELRFALGQAAGVGDQQTSTMLATLTRRMGEAVAGNDTYTDALESLGVSLEDVASGAVTTDEVFNRLADAMKNASSDAEAAALASELLGRAGGELGPKLRASGADIDALRERAQELGIVLGGETLDASEEFTDKMDELSKQMGAAKAAIGQALLPVALSLATAFQDKVIPAIVSITEGVAKAIDWFGQLPGPVQEAAGIIAGALGVGGPVLMAVGLFAKALGGLVLAAGPIGLLIAAAALLGAAWMKWGDDIKRIVGDVANWFGEKFPAMAEFGGIFVEEMKRYAQGFIDLFKAIFQGDLQGIMDSLVEIIGTPLRIIAGMWESDFAAPIRETVGGAIEWLKDSFNSMIDFFRELPGQMMQIGRDIVAGLWQGLTEAWENFSIRDTVAGWGTSMLDSIKGVLRSNSPSMAFHDIGMDVGRGLRNGIVDSFGMVRAAVSDLGAQVTSGAFDMAKGVVDAMGQMFQGSKPIAAAQALINTFQGITEALKLGPKGIPQAALIAAQGFAAVASINKARPGSSGGASAAAPGSGGASFSAQPAPPQVTITPIFQGGSGQLYTEQDIIAAINRGADMGYTINPDALGAA